MNSIQEAIKDLRAGKMVILVDDVRRENEGDFVIAAEKIRPEHLNFISDVGRGITCLSMSQDEVNRLQIPMMVPKNNSYMNTPFTVSIEATEGVTTGSSSFDRVKTILTAVNPKSKPTDIVMPGHVFPLSAAPGGVFVRRGHTEGSIDLMRVAGLKPMAEVAESTGKLTNIRNIGSIVAADLISPTPIPRMGYKVYQEAVKLGALLRPLGNTIYWFPPLNISKDVLVELKEITQKAIVTAYHS